MSNRKRKKSKAALHALVIAALLGASGFLTVEMQKKKEEGRIPDLDVATAPHPNKQVSTKSYRYERLTKPARTVVREGGGSVVATFTDGARTANLTGPTRTFSEPRTTKEKVVTDQWVRLLPQPWTNGAEETSWFKDWFKKNLGSKSDDVFAVAFQYGDKAPTHKNDAGQRSRGDAIFGPIDPNGVAVGDQRKEQSDFYDYLGVAWQFKDGVLEYPEQEKYGALDCSGFVRMVYGYRMAYPLNGNDLSTDDGLPRTANGMATKGPGVPVLPLKKTGNKDPLYFYARPTSIDVLQPGDLIFFEIDRRTGTRMDHSGIYMGLDTAGHPRFVSSREEANGPTMGDLGGDSRLDGNGYYAKYLRTAKRL
ncbi:NlpC/P60 family protein [Wenjunlia tyrosinilytica]|uniref:NlpC/P60 domain-containing protein n=1 Tax=Wenjunlia tyrosinilytica TaxID=1544741 RepID=A0A917ZL59_9ACTN|nr:NlpC/P60 family protein [Wenjunlia tyrosinilytica]GGO86012.1 hypothetical protein GCM10012280_21120 [Wenjunlia tyrosinilytica]